MQCASSSPRPDASNRRREHVKKSDAINGRDFMMKILLTMSSFPHFFFKKMINTHNKQCRSVKERLKARVSQAMTQYAVLPGPPLFSVVGIEMSSSMMMVTGTKESICEDV